MKQRKYTDQQISLAKAAKDCGIRCKVIARKVGIDYNYLISGNTPWDDVPPDPAFVDRFNELFSPCAKP